MERIHFRKSGWTWRVKVSYFTIMHFRICSHTEKTCPLSVIFHHMQFQWCMVLECLLTSVTLEWLFIWMCSNMFIQLRLKWKFSAAEFTSKHVREMFPDRFIQRRTGRLHFVFCPFVMCSYRSSHKTYKEETKHLEKYGTITKIKIYIQIYRKFHLRKPKNFR